MRLPRNTPCDLKFIVCLHDQAREKNVLSIVEQAQQFISLHTPTLDSLAITATPAMLNSARGMSKMA